MVCMEFDFKILGEKCYTFFEEYKRKEIDKIIHTNSSYILVDFEELSEFDIELTDALLSNPPDILRLLEETLGQFYQREKSLNSYIRVRLTSLPKTEHILIRNLRSEHLGKLVYIEGQVRRKTDVRPKLTAVEYLCTNPSCSLSQEKIKVPQLEVKARILKTCPKCKSRLELVNKILRDSQILTLEELSENLESSSEQPKRINILLQEDLVSPFKEGRTNPGSKVFVVGIVKEVPIPLRTGSESVNYDLIVEGNFIDLLESDYSDTVITKEEEKEIKELSKQKNVMEVLISSTAPSIYGNNRIKEAILLQLFGGVGTIKADGVKVRGDIHILLIGDPGAAKSQMLKAATKIAPKSSFVSGKSASGVGLTATVLRDDLTRGWALEAGSLVLASGGLCAIDEMDKMSEDDTSAMHEALEQQTISVAKANIRATLRCETSVLGAANPKYGRFDPYGDIGKQINFPPALMSRFDLIFILRDTPGKKKDTIIAEHILQTHRDTTKSTPTLSSDFLKKYIAYTKKLKPKLTQDAIREIRDFYVKIRDSAGGNENEVSSVPVTARQLEAIVRLSEGYAKMELQEKVTKEHAQKAIELLMYCLEKIGIDPKTGKLDVDRITTGVTATTRNQYRIIQDIIETLEIENKEVKFEDVITDAQKQSIKKFDVERVLEKLKEEGIIFEPKKNIYKRMT